MLKIRIPGNSVDEDDLRYFLFMFGAIKAGYKVSQSPSIECLFLTLVVDVVRIAQKQ